MPDYRIDRRVLRTRAALEDAFLRLILEKGYDSIAIQDICQAANIGRSTFYEHYVSKEDLKRSGLKHLRMQLQHAPNTAGASEITDAPPLQFSLPIFQHAKLHAPLYLALRGSEGAAVALEAIRAMVTDLVRQELLIVIKPEGIERQMLIQYVVGGFMSMLAWLDSGAPGSAETADVLFRTMAVPGLTEGTRPCQ